MQEERRRTGGEERELTDAFPTVQMGSPDRGAGETDMRRIMGVASMLMLSGGAAADVLSGFAFSVTAMNTDTGDWGTFKYILRGGEVDDNGNLDWELDAPIEIYSNRTGTLLGTLGSASVNLIADPVVGVSFSVLAAGQNTQFQINSAVLGFSTIDASVATGQASASVSVTDFNFDSNTWIATGPQGGYRALVNPGTGNEQVFSTLFNGGPFVGSGLSTTFNDDSGPFSLIGIDTSSISANFDFVLSAGDLATGTSTFTVVPAPAGLGLVGLGGLLLARRRR
jgi:hypothetical protein